jgi:hypothetical protein
MRPQIIAAVMGLGLFVEAGRVIGRVEMGSRDSRGGVSGCGDIDALQY